VEEVVKTYQRINNLLEKWNKLAKLWMKVENKSNPIEEQVT
jgi:head-tail adaptor